MTKVGVVHSFGFADWDGEEQVPFDFAQGRLSTSLRFGPTAGWDRLHLAVGMLSPAEDAEGDGEGYHEPGEEYGHLEGELAQSQALQHVAAQCVDGSR